MTITIQLTEIPQNESVDNRIFTLPKTGGDFGAAFECLIQLPDRSGQVADIHGQFIASKQGMMIEAINGNRISINGNLLASGRTAIIEDGTMIEIADYTMLISQIDSEEVFDVGEQAIQPSNENSHFSLDDLQANDNDDVVMRHHKQESNSAMNDNDKTHLPNQQPHFTAKGVFSDDPFDEDPFKDEDITLVSDEEIPTTSHSELENNENIETLTTDKDDIDSEVICFESSVIEPTSNKQRRQENQNIDNAKVDQLVALLGNQITTANQQQAGLFAAIDKTLSTFIEEFSPKHLEDVYSDFGTPLFVQKESQYWRSYRKSFNRRADKGEYHRLFKALLLENMQLDNMKNKDDNG